VADMEKTSKKETKLDIVIIKLNEKQLGYSRMGMGKKGGQKFH